MNLDLDAERSVLGGIMLEGKFPLGVDTLKPRDFSHERHAAIFAAMQILAEKREPIDELTVRAAVAGTRDTNDWAVFVAKLTEDVPTAANVGHYANIVRREARRRDLVRACVAALEQAKEIGSDADEVMQRMSIRLAELAEGREAATPVAMAELVREELSAIQKRHEKGVVVGLQTGFRDLDGAIGGLQASGLIVIGGRPGMGKTTLATNVVENMALRDGKSALIFTFEMTREEQVQRSIASESRVDLSRIRSGLGLRDTDWPKLAVAMNRLNTDNIHLCDKPNLEVADIRSIARQFASRRKLDVIVIDYLQLMDGRGQSREQEVSGISRGLRALALELRIPVIALSQLNRSLESRSDKRPMLSDLRESGALEQDASQVIFVYRDEEYDPDTKEPGIAELIVAKNRNGRTGTVKLRWSGKYTRFDPIDDDAELPLPAKTAAA